jgi:hypothetical protein
LRHTAHLANGDLLAGCFQRGKRRNGRGKATAKPQKAPSNQGGIEFVDTKNNTEPVNPSVAEAAQAFGVSPSAVSERLVEATAQKLKQFRERPLEDFAPLAVFLDTVHRGGSAFVVAWGWILMVRSGRWASGREPPLPRPRDSFDFHRITAIRRKDILVRRSLIPNAGTGKIFARHLGGGIYPWTGWLHCVGPQRSAMRGSGRNLLNGRHLTREHLSITDGNLLLRARPYWALRG